jgi:ribosome-associated toxin RatA of RatAB toxin-antitoxin module
MDIEEPGLELEVDAADFLEVDSERSEITDVDDLELLQSVEILTEAPQKRGRKIVARLSMPYSASCIWKVLTDYEMLPDFIPSLKVSKRLAHPAGGIRLEQVGTQRLLRLNFSARVVLDLEEQFPHRINFQMVEGDFQDFSGCWLIEGSSPEVASTYLCYSVNVLPKRTMPVRFIEGRLRRDIAVNLLAIRRRVESLSKLL